MLPYTSDHLKFRNLLRDFCRFEVTPNVDTWEKSGQVARDIWKKMGAQGFLCTQVPKKYGGMGADFLYSVIALEEVARTNHYGLDAFLHSDIVAPYILSYGNEEQKQKYLPGCVSGDIVLAVAMTEPDAGSDLASMRATALEENGSVVINGTKTFIFNGLLCDLAIVAAKDPDQENRHMAVSLYLVEASTKGFIKGKGLEKMGVHSQDTAELVFQNCQVPTANRLGEKGSGFFLLMEKLQQERLLVALLGMVMAEIALEWTINHLKSTQKRLSQATTFRLVELSTQATISRTFVDQLVLEHMAGKKIDAKTCMAKYSITEMANQLVSQCLDLVGPDAARESLPLARAFRDLRVASIFAGANEIMKIIVARSMNL